MTADPRVFLQVLAAKINPTPATPTRTFTLLPSLRIFTQIEQLSEINARPATNFRLIFEIGQNLHAEDRQKINPHQDQANADQKGKSRHCSIERDSPWRGADFLLREILLQDHFPFL